MTQEEAPGKPSPQRTFATRKEGMADLGLANHELAASPASSARCNVMRRTQHATGAHLPAGSVMAMRNLRRSPRATVRRISATTGLSSSVSETVIGAASTSSCPSPHPAWLARWTRTSGAATCYSWLKLSHLCSTPNWSYRRCTSIRNTYSLSSATGPGSLLGKAR